jgi:hypothetical protein
LIQLNGLSRTLGVHHGESKDLSDLLLEIPVVFATAWLLYLIDHDNIKKIKKYTNDSFINIINPIK